MARPTQSEVLYIQQIGRVLRPFKVCICGKEYIGEKECPTCGSIKLKYLKTHALILDHGCNTDRHGLPDKIRDAIMTKEDKKKKAGLNSLVKLRQCFECFMYCKAHIKECPDCGAVIKGEDKDTLKEEEGELVLMTREDIRSRRVQLIREAYTKAHKQARYKSKYYCPYTEIFKKYKGEALEAIKFPDHLIKKFKTQVIVENAKGTYR
jgi:superfamily II DNA or RNA helicase